VPRRDRLMREFPAAEQVGEHQRGSLVQRAGAGDAHDRAVRAPSYQKGFGVDCRPLSYKADTSEVASLPLSRGVIQLRKARSFSGIGFRSG
jgi:hypothetical protein